MSQPDPLPDRLYHYTDAGGLYGILKDKNLWATHAAYLNDSREFLYGMDLIEAELEKLASPPPIEVQTRPVPTLSDLIAAMPMATSLGLQQQFRC